MRKPYDKWAHLVIFTVVWLVGSMGGIAVVSWFGLEAPIRYALYPGVLIVSNLVYAAWVHRSQRAAIIPTDAPDAATAAADQHNSWEITKPAPN